jgi:predicted ribosome quality control (RQC) complex YloA/Tae2 family protein
MYLDYFTLSALVDEFLDVLVGGRIQDVIDVDETGLGLEIYAERKRRYLYLSADQHTPRIHWFDEKLRRGLVKPTQLGLLFRRYIEGSILTHVSQPSWERIIQLDVQGPEGGVSIVVEPMERRSNILLLRQGIIVDCMRRVGPDENRFRLSLPNYEYRLPPPQLGKHDPTRIQLEELEAVYAQSDDPKRKSSQVLATRLLGVSPLLAKEIIYRASGDVNQKAAAVDPERVLDALHEVVVPLSRHQWQPGVVEAATRVEAYSVYPLQSMPGWHSIVSVNQALSRYYGAPVGDDAYLAAKVPVGEAIQEAQIKLRSRIAALEKSMTDESERQQFQHSGELILAYQFAIQPGQAELKAQYDPDQPELTVELDPGLSPLENAQAYFARYEKAKRALDDVPDLLQNSRSELDYLNQLAVDLEFARSWPEIDEVQQVLQARGHWRNKLTKRIAGSGQSAPLKIVTKEGFVIWVGRNSRQNEQVTFGKGNGQDLWLHARGVPGAHVILKSDGRKIPESVIDIAASLAAYYSAGRNEGKMLVDVTRCMYVKKIRGAAPGMVTYRNEATRTAVPYPETHFQAARFSEKIDDRLQTDP